jgi:hypothetical protein
MTAPPSRLPSFLREDLRIFFEYGWDTLPCPDCGGFLDETEHPEALEYTCRDKGHRFVVLLT